MNAIERNDVKKLLSQATWPTVSIYMPVELSGDQVQQNPIRLKNLIQKAESLLASHGVGHDEAQAILKRLRPLVDDVKFWRDRSPGIALFAQTGSLTCWRLDEPFHEWASVGRRPYVKPLFSAIHEDGSYYVLALSQNSAQLYRAAAKELELLDVPGIPPNLKAALREDQPEAQVQVRTGQPAIHGKEGRVFHGQGTSQHHKADIEEYFREVDRAVTPFLRKQGRGEPLVFCGVDYLWPIFQRVNHYENLHDAPACGSPDGLSRTELREHAATALAASRISARDRDSRQLESAQATGLVTADIEEILPAASAGRIDCLFVASDVQLWGRYDAQHGRLELGASDNAKEDLLDVAAVETLRHGGRVYAVHSAAAPLGLFVCAKLRYPTPAAATID